MCYTRRWLALVGLSILAGCGTQAGEDKSNKSPDSPEAPSKQAEKKVEIKIASADQVFAQVKKYAGKAVVIDCWSTYCEPCKKEYPGLLKMQQKYGDKLTCLSVCLDFTGVDKPEDSQEEALKFLKEVNSTIDNYLSSTADTDFFQALKKEFKLPEAPAGVPIILVFDKDGKLVKRWDTTNLAEEKDFSYAKNVEPVVEKLVKP
jgi:thiol-disulfide isomerase/thioredoxin